MRKLKPTFTFILLKSFSALVSVTHLGEKLLKGTREGPAEFVGYKLPSPSKSLFRMGFSISLKKTALGELEKKPHLAYNTCT